MTVFRYKAIDKEGKTIRGILDSENEADVEQRLYGMGLDLINLHKVSTLFSHFRSKRVSRRDLITFCFHLEQQGKAGIPLMEGLRDLRESVDNQELKEITALIVEKVESGKSLSQAMEDFPNVFDTVFVNLIRAGERSGQIVEILGSLNETLKWQDEIASQMKKALLYPAFVAVSVIGVIAAMMIFLVPELIKFITTMQSELPLQTKILIFISDGVRLYGHYLFIGIVVTIFIFNMLLKQSTRVALFVDGVKLKLWIIGPTLKKLMVSRFAHHFALLYSAGINIPECLRISEGIVGNKVLANAIKHAGKTLEDGHSISASFEQTTLFPKLVLRMLKVGESTGALDTALYNISYFFNRDVNESMEKMQAMIGPTMTVILGAILGWVILSVLGPIYDTLTTVTL